jgi:hypothetical protein
METTELEVKNIEQEGLSMEAQVAAIVIRNDQDYQSAGALFTELKAKLKAAEPPLEEQVSRAHKMWKETRAWADGILKPWKNAYGQLGIKIGEWDMKVREKRRKEEEAARAKAEAEAKAKRDAEIAEAMKRKDKEAVKELKAAPVVAAPVTIKTPEPTKVQGLNTRYTWVLDRIANPTVVPKEFWVIDEKLIRDRIKSLGKNHGIPGVIAKEVPITSGRV